MRARLIAATLFVTACGARTGLDVPMFETGTRVDAARPDTGLDAPFDAGPICTPNVTLLPAHADVVLVLDRSGSMTMPLASGLESRWTSLHRALASALPTFDANVAFGATIFPIPGATADTVCSAGASLDVPVGLNMAPAILAALDAHGPFGGTPTADAIVVAQNALASRTRTGVPQAIVLCTDGGPNCNPSGAGQTWFGQAPETCAAEGFDPQMCLDTARTVDRNSTARTAGMPTYVIALDVAQSYLIDALDQMARAGGRARTSGTTYYDVQNPDDLRAAFHDIATRVSSCSFVPSGALPMMGPMDVFVLRVGETIIPRDDSRANGWTIGATGTFDLYGPACDLAMRNGSVVRIDGVCR